MRLMRPPKNTRCDFHVGAGLDSLGAPVLIRCPNTATVAGLGKSGVVGEVWMCESCWATRSEMFERRVPREVNVESEDQR
jgi:hypothetical protein